MLFCCLWRNVETFCHKHFVVVSRHQQTPPLTTSNKCHDLLRSGGAVLIIPGGCSVDSTRWSKILTKNRDFCLPHLHSTSLRRAAMPVLFLLSGPKWVFRPQGWHVAPINVKFGTGVPVPNFTFIGAEMWGYSHTAPKTQNFEFWP